MARLIRPLRQWPKLQHHCCCRTTFNYFLSSPLSLAFSTKSILHCLSCATLPSSHRSIHHRSRRPRLPNALVPSDVQEGDASDSDLDAKKSRNQKKREARQAVRWGMELASFSNPHIKRILRLASLDEEVFDALMIAKRLGPDVREGKRRQFSYIGKLLREVDPELMDALIRATKEGDQRTLQSLAGSQAQMNVDDEDDNEETNVEDEQERSQENVSIATRWFDGLIGKDMKVTNEIYSLHSVDFDRQELRKLVRKVHSVQERRKEITEESEENVNAAVMAAEKSLTRFLHALAKQMPSE